jgi:hypothetical protein
MPERALMIYIVFAKIANALTVVSFDVTDYPIIVGNREIWVK